MEVIFANIILLKLYYFLFILGYSHLVLAIVDYFILGYFHNSKFLGFFNYSKLFHTKIRLVILNYFWIF
jgi:hypothetical protein